MNSQSNNFLEEKGITLVLGATGKTGRRIFERLQKLGVSTRGVSRWSSPVFDWNDSGTWHSVLEGVTAVYISYAPDLAVPGAADTIRRFVDLATSLGVQRLVLLAGRGEEEAQACERIVQASAAEWTIVRASWFMQNFSEGEFLPMVQSGTITLPAADVPEPFIDVDDIADVAVAALTEEGHAYQIYEVTGPRLLTFNQVAQTLSEVADHPVAFMRISSDEFNQALTDSGAPAEIIWLLNYLFETVLDGHNASLADGVQRALGRPPRDFVEFARNAAATGVWKTQQ